MAAAALHLGDYTILLAPEEQTLYSSFLSQTSTSNALDRAELLRQIPYSSSRTQRLSYGPLVTLSILLDQIPGSWPVLQLQQTHATCWTSLPEEAKAGRGPEEAKNLIERVDGQCKASYNNLIELFPQSDATAIVDPESGRQISHNTILSSIQNFSLPLKTKQDGAPKRKPVVAISLPNGPLLAMTVMATAAYYTAAPVAHGANVGAEQFMADLSLGGADAVIACESDISRLGLRELAGTGVQVFLAELFPEPTESRQILVMRTLDGQDLDLISGNSAISQTTTTSTPTIANSPDDTGILLFTSGTSGTKKLVPLHVHTIVNGVAQVVESWGLTPSSRCLNQMPLNHVGGLVRNLYGPILSGGSLIACTAFDAELFWDCVEDYAPTWYYASPSMHQVILDVSVNRPEAVAKSRIGLICNAAGGLLPSLACRLRDTFSCTVLPSYGMTECMPISTPPLTYKLDRTGTSGISVGPDLAILGDDDEPVHSGTVGRIAVRGLPVFRGYLKAGNVLDKSCVTKEGWFDTGDMGSLDSDGYLYVTGRSKEVINRGGELISPFEVEEAIIAASNTIGSPVEGRISRVLALSAPHEVMQEVVGVAVETAPGSQRPCLRSIQDSVRNKLAQAKLPVLVVYMDNGLPTNNGKVVRIKLAERLGLPTINDSTPEAEKNYEAICPPVNSALSIKISCSVIQPDYQSLQATCQMNVPENVDVHIRLDRKGFYPELILAPKTHDMGEDTELIEDSEALLSSIRDTFAGYHVPREIHQIHQLLPRDDLGLVDNQVLDAMIAVELGVESHELSPTEQKVATAFATVLDLRDEELAPTSDFFMIGGDSMKAGRLLSILRSNFSLRLPIDALFTNSTISALAALINERCPAGPPQPAATARSSEIDTLANDEFSRTCSSTNPFLMLLQLFPIMIVFPAKRALTWTTFLYCLAGSQYLSTNNTIPGRMLSLCVSLAIGRIVSKSAVPLVGIIFKWLVIGRYKEGVYPMWSFYHTRWWLVEKVIAICGTGIWGMFGPTRTLYYRALGAKIGKNVKINRGASLGEYDLLTIDDGATLERCNIRPFAAERNTKMYLGRIHIGKNAVVGLASIVAAGTTVPDGACMGANSSSWEVATTADEANRDLASSNIPPAPWALSLVLGFPLALLVRFVGMIPWLCGLVALVTQRVEKASGDIMRQVIFWFARDYRVGWHYLALALHVSFGPAFYFFAVLLVKKIFDVCCGGAIEATRDAQSRSTFGVFRAQLIRTLLPGKQLHKLSHLFGSHYEATSVLYRLMGSRVGRGVYWPGTGPSVQDYSLIDIGDNVVFGSRSHFVTSDGTGSDFVRVGSGAMIADRVVLHPGTTVGEGTVLGSGALTKRDTRYPSHTTWVGSRNNEAICLTSGAKKSNNEKSHTLTTHVKMLDESGTTTPTSSQWSPITPMSMSTFDMSEKPTAKQTSFDAKEEEGASSPFARAFYQGKASYRVWGQFTIFVYSVIITVLTAVYWNVGSVSAVQVIAVLFRRNEYFLSYWLSPARPLVVYGLFTAFIAVIMTFQAVLATAIIIVAKWMLLGRRQQGNYDWDKSPYCQRWQLFLQIDGLRRDCYGGLGILGLLTGTQWTVWYFRLLGAKIGKNCALFASGKPELYFTEPDLLTLGDRVAVDDASLVCHINTRGKFDLNPLFVGDRSVLRTGSRLLSGAMMENDSCLLEHTLVMAGDVVDEGSTRQGWPAEDFDESRTPTLKPTVKP